jgi:hypothetical protein
MMRRAESVAEHNSVIGNYYSSESCGPDLDQRCFRGVAGEQVREGRNLREVVGQYGQQRV